MKAEMVRFCICVPDALERRVEDAQRSVALTIGGKGRGQFAPKSKLYHAGAELLLEEISAGRVKTVPPGGGRPADNTQLRLDAALRDRLRAAGAELDPPASVGAMIVCGVAMLVQRIEAGESVVDMPSLSVCGARQQAGRGEVLSEMVPSVIYSRLKKAPRPLNAAEEELFEAEASRLREGQDVEIRGTVFTFPGDEKRRPRGEWSIHSISGRYCMLEKAGQPNALAAHSVHVYDVEVSR